MYIYWPQEATYLFPQGLNSEIDGCDFVTSRVFTDYCILSVLKPSALYFTPHTTHASRSRAASYKAITHKTRGCYYFYEWLVVSPRNYQANTTRPPRSRIAA